MFLVLFRGFLTFFAAVGRELSVTFWDYFSGFVADFSGGFGASLEWNGYC